MPDFVPPPLSRRPAARSRLALAPSAAQRRAAFALVAVGVALTGLRLLRDRAHVPDPPPPIAPRAAELETRLDPNAASADDLAALPGLGPKTARAFVDARDRRRADGHDPPFRTRADLLRVPGLGDATRDRLAEHLRFPGEP